MHRLQEKKEGNKQNFYFTAKRSFQSAGIYGSSIVNKVFEFAFGMTFGSEGEHRKHRSGGQVERMQGEVFANAFQGKLAEFGLWIKLNNAGIQCSEPSLDKWELGRWDSSDIEVSEKRLCIKSAKFFSNLVLLETKDWNGEGLYIPNIESGHAYYDLLFLVRIKPNVEQIMRTEGFFYADQVDKNQVETIITEENWKYDLPGFATHDQVAKAIKDRQILPQNSYLTGRTRMDAENYYIQSGDLIDLVKLKEFLS